MFLIAGSIIAAAGLATDNSVIVVASMLVSPLIGPILGFTFGLVQGDKRLVWSSLVNETIAIVISILLGVLSGVVLAPAGVLLAWPTFEIASRGQPIGLAIGVVVAVASGAATAVGITSNSIAALVGVAISASLLPPAVNTGITLAYAFLGPLIHGPLVDGSAFAFLGLYSFLLLIVNIIFIKVVAYLFFHLKAVKTGSNPIWENLYRTQTSGAASVAWEVGRHTIIPDQTLAEYVTAVNDVDKLLAQPEQLEPTEAPGSSLFSLGHPVHSQDPELFAHSHDQGSSESPPVGTDPIPQIPVQGALVD